MSYKRATIRQRNLRFDIYHDSLHPVTPFSRFLLHHFPSVKGKIVVDWGVGSGVLTAAAGLLGAKKVYGIDVNPQALTLAAANTKRLRLTNIEYIRNNGDLHRHFSAESIDIVVANPASFPSATRLHSFFDGGECGNRVIFEMIRFSARVLKKNGALDFIHTSLVPRSLTDEVLHECGFKFSVVASKRLKFRAFYYPHLPHFERLAAKYRDVAIEHVGENCYETLYLYHGVRSRNNGV